MSEQFFDPGAQVARERPVSVWRWTLWWVALVFGMLLFYVILTPIWLGLRGAAWAAEFRARRKRPATG